MFSGLAWLVMPQTFRIEYGFFLFRSWNLFTIIGSLPSIILACLLMRLPESPKFLLAKGKYNETIDCLKFVHRWNNNADVKFPVSSNRPNRIWSSAPQSIKIKCPYALANILNRSVLLGDFYHSTGSRPRVEQGLLDRTLREYRRAVHVEFQIRSHNYVYHSILFHHQVTAVDLMKRPQPTVYRTGYTDARGR